ncbi:MAG: hypothetical protein AMJ79_05490 [Phycisphaerae bacterium SM23_30]|nr:MAG: hypothetical protein AMJ79_05490 [Phycisphaerae bacterium SM23_30]
MRVPYGEGVATNTGPESCGGVREGITEALAGDCTGQVLSRENLVLQDADGVNGSGRQYSSSRYRKRWTDPAWSETLCMYISLSHGNREIPQLALEHSTGVRAENPKGARRR